MTASAARSAPPVPVVLMRLKLQIMRNRSRQRGGGLKAPLAAIAAVGSGVIGFAWIDAIAHSHDARVSRAAVVLGATVIVVGWALLPLLTFGTDETLDPARLQLLPLRRRPLISGLLAASFIGYAPLAVLLILAGVVVGFASGAGAIVTLLAVVILAVLAATTARTLATALAASITSRRGRDVVVGVGALLGVSVQLIRFVHFVSIDAALLDRVSNVARWLPPGMLGQAIVDGRAGHLARATVELVPALLVIPLLLVLWNRLLERSLTIVRGGSTPIHVASGSSGASVLFPRVFPFLPRKPWGAVAAKELRYVVRDPRRRIVLGQLLIIGVGGPTWLAISARSLSPGSVLIASLAGYLALIGALNQFGFDGGAIWLDIVAGNDVRSELVGKNVALLVQTLPVVFFGSFALALASGGWAYMPVAIVIAASGIGAGLAIANTISVHFPQRIPETRSPFGGAGGGQGCATSLILLGGMIVQGVLLAPVAIAAGICAAVAPVAFVVVAPACGFYGYVLWRVATGRAARWAAGKQPELLLAVDPRRGS